MACAAGPAYGFLKMSIPMAVELQRRAPPSPDISCVSPYPHYVGLIDPDALLELITPITIAVTVVSTSSQALWCVSASLAMQSRDVAVHGGWAQPAARSGTRRPCKRAVSAPQSGTLISVRHSQAKSQRARTLTGGCSLNSEGVKSPLALRQRHSRGATPAGGIFALRPLRCGCRRVRHYHDP